MKGTPLGAVSRDGDTDGFLDWAGSGRFLIRRCGPCGHHGGPAERRCAACGSFSTEEVAAGGGARVVSWTVVHGRRPEGGAAPVTIVAIGELDEGPWWWTQVRGAGPLDMRTGRALRIDFEPAGGGEMLPVFRLA